MRRPSPLLLAILLLAPVGAAFAQSWPAKPVKLILSQPAGGSPDIAARLVADRLSRLWGQQIVIENRPGGQNIIGSQAAARSAPDGYNFFWATTAAVVTNLYTFKSLPYDPIRDFTPVGFVGLSPFVIAVHPSVPANTLPELLALDRKEPGRLTLATEGPRSFSGMLMSMFNLTAGSQFLLVPYVATPQAIQDGLAGSVNIVVTSSAAMTPYLRRGDLRPLAVSSAKRVPGLDNVPALAETYPGFTYVGWYVVFAPAGTPAEVVLKFNRDLDAVLKEKELAQRLYDLGVVVEGAGTLASVQAFLDAEHARWSKTIKEVGIVPD